MEKTHTFGKTGLKKLAVLLFVLVISCLMLFNLHIITAATVTSIQSGVTWYDNNGNPANGGGTWYENGK